MVTDRAGEPLMTGALFELAADTVMLKALSEVFVLPSLTLMMMLL
jgi:hypothetical protein